MAAAHRAAVLHSPRDTIHTVLNMDGTWSSTRGKGRTGRRLVRAGSWPAGPSLGKQPELVPVRLPASAGGVLGKEGQRRPERSQHVHPFLTTQAEKRLTPLECQQDLGERHAPHRPTLPSLDTCWCLSSEDATKCPSQDCVYHPLCPPPLPSAQGHDQQAPRAT